MVNGNINGYLDVPAQMVRFRLLNGSSHRFFEFALNDNRTFHQIAGDESLLNMPVAMTKLMLSPGERAEIIVDFSGQNGNTYYLKQLGTQLPSGYPGGAPGMMGTPGPLDNTDFNLLEFRVISATAGAINSLPSVLTNNFITSPVGAGTKTFLLQGLPMNSMTNFTINGVQYDENVINFTTKQDSVMIWDITNQSMMPHPWHIHGNHFFIQSINGSAPPDNMLGRKDVVVVPPQGGNVKLIMKYVDFSNATMPYMYHCHISSHEDKGMMGQFLVTPKAPENINELDMEVPGIGIYPNPGNGLFTITSLYGLIKNISITSSLGQIVLNKAISSNNADIDISSNANGLYNCTVETTTGTKFIKIIKQ
jgi:bilirubin oxidase